MSGTCLHSNTQMGGTLPIARGVLALWLALPAGRSLAEGLRGAGMPVRQVAP